MRFSRRLTTAKDGATKMTMQKDCRTCMSYRRISPAFRNMHSDERTFRVGQKRIRPEGRAQWNRFFEDSQGCSTFCQDCQECSKQWRISPAFRNMHSDEINFPSGRRVNARQTPAGR